jgi:hypothetical protein
MCWSFRGKWEGSRDCMEEKRNSILWVVQVKGKIDGWDVMCGEWITKRAVPPYGIVALA